MCHVPQIAAALLLPVALGTAYANDATGSWEYRGPADSGMWLKTEQVGHKVRFQLELARGAPSYNSGWIEGAFEVHDASGVFRTNQYGVCEITFEFARSSVRITESENRQECGFGYNVHANGTLLLKSREAPKFSDGDPRLGSK